MPPRRPPSAGPALTTTLLALVLIVPTILAAAQQQQPQDTPYSRSPRAEARVDNDLPPKHAQSKYAAVKRRPYTPILAQNERAVATTVSSAPAVSAVRAPSDQHAASQVLDRSARSLQDWEVEDFVLLATVDGHLHARDRYNGKEIWELDIKKPMLETIYNTSDGSEQMRDQQFIWIVEPREDGALYVLTPGPYPVLQNLHMTVKQLADDLSPWTSEDPELPVVYTAWKKTTMLVVDARTGSPRKVFSPSGVLAREAESCVPQTTEYFHTRESECKGVFNIGQTEYTITVHNELTNQHLCTIKYTEWTPNNRDRDLQAQYLAPMDDQYIYSTYDGHAVAYHPKRKNWSKNHVFRQPLSYPVARVFDVAKPNGDEDPEPTLVLLPQPPGPAFFEDRTKHVWLNTTDTGSWFALSEISYPAVTDTAPKAACYTHNELLGWDPPYSFPDPNRLVGVHVLDYEMDTPQQFRQISAPPPSSAEPERKTYTISDEEPAKERLTIEPPPVIESRALSVWWMVVLTCVVLATSVASYKRPTQLDTARSYLSNLVKPGDKPVQQQIAAVPTTPQPDPQPAEETSPDPPTSEITPHDEPVIEPTEKAEAVETEPAVGSEPKEKKVTFDIPDDDEADLEPLSRATTIDQESVAENNNATPLAPNGDTQSASNDSTTVPLDPTTPPATPEKKKKKTHRGKRGGVKGKNKKPKEEEDVDRIIDAAKQLETSPTLHPDEVTVNGDDIQDVSNIKKIGKLTIDFDRLLGNGSGGTFVFEGKWNEREVAVKRMLPQYFGLAEQEVKLLQESDLHPNVIRYFDDEKDENFLYIAVELCQASLFDLYRDGRPGEELTEVQQRLATDISCDVPRALYQLANGVNHLHSLRIIHRDIKPQNILIAYPQRNQKGGPRLVISDFGLCKTLPDNVSTLIGTTGNAGTVGWKAPELITQPKEADRNSSTLMSRDSSSSTDPVSQGVKRAVDIFSLGCVFFYVLTNGCHPFDDDEGWMQIREYNIKKEKANLSQLQLGDDSEEPYRLIEWMLKSRPELRPTALQVMNHPFFWSPEKRLNFLCDCSDHWEREPRDPPSEHLSVLEEYSYEVLDHKRNFLGKLDHSFINSLGKQRKYTGDRMLDLLRALRNKKNHYEDMDENVKAKVGPLPHGYLRYWTTKFPKLLMSCYDCVEQCGLQNEPRFRPYFEGQTM